MATLDQKTSSVEAKNEAGDRLTAARLGRAEWQYGLLFVVFILIPLLCLSLLFLGLFPEFWRREDAHSTMLLLLYVLLCIVVAVPTANLLVMVYASFQAARRGGTERRSALDFALHVVPYGILSLAMLFEHDRILRAEPEGLAAIASIIILFLLSELGLVIYESVRRAESVSGRFATTLSRVEERLRFLPWLQPYLKLSISAEEDAKLVENVGELLNQYADLSQDVASGATRSLARFFLLDYVSEELRDVRAELEEPDVPKEVIPPLAPLPNKKKGYSYFVTNVGFYSQFVRNAIKNLKVHTRHVPCLAVITNALPAQFWLWMSGATAGEYYKPVADYLDAQFTGTKDYSLRVFRTILVGPDGPAPEEGELHRSSIPALLSESEWTKQKPWSLVLNPPDFYEVLTTADILPVARTTYLVPQLAWTPDNGDPVTDPRKSKTCWVINRLPGAGEGRAYHYIPLWQFYCSKLHIFESGVSGATEVFKVTPEQFAARPPDGFNSCPDLMFLGRCPQAVSDVWQQAGEEPEWDLALMTSMSAQTQTMFLTLIYDGDQIKRLWDGFRTARAKLGDSIASSRPLKQGGQHTGTGAPE